MSERDYDSFAAAAREQLALRTATLALISVPVSRQNDIYMALRSKLRRHDIVACYDATHVILLLVDLPVAVARERLAEMVTRLGPGDPPRFHLGLSSSPEAGAREFDALVKDAVEASAVAHDRGVLIVVAGEATPAPQSGPVVRGTVVVADDDPEVARLIDAQLRSAGFRTILAADGQQALAAIEEHAPDLVIVDMMMPNMTGLEVLTALRNRPARPRVIVLSARGREQDVTRAFALGADDYVTKPFSPQELLARIERLLR
jgi:two-component system OmpR family response regulator